ncbi:MAG: hypothetical protein ABSG38_08205 [Spirochaetia bacterium]
MKLRVPIFAFALCLAGAAGQELSAQSPSLGSMRPGRQISLAKVKDTFFSYVLGIVLTGLEVDLDNAQMREILTEFQTKLKFPFDMVTRVIQHTEPDSGERTISLIFNGDVFIPIPYSFFGYHPGTLRSTETLSFRVTRFAYTDPKDPQAYTPVYDLSLSDGSILLDIDSWLVYVLGNLLDKLDVRHVVFFSYQGAWIGLVEGRGRIWNRDMREYFDFTNNRIVYPVSDKLDAMGKGFIAASRPLADH